MIGREQVWGGVVNAVLWVGVMGVFGNLSHGRGVGEGEGEYGVGNGGLCVGKGCGVGVFRSLSQLTVEFGGVNM